MSEDFVYYKHPKKVSFSGKTYIDLQKACWVTGLKMEDFIRVATIEKIGVVKKEWGRKNWGKVPVRGEKK